jgi:sugar/nucleoside kinase (ribokinase family)
MNDRTTDDLQFGAFATFDPVLPEKYLKTKFLFLANIQPALQLKILDQMKCKPITMFDTIDFYINNDNKMVKKVLKKVDGAILNDSEAMLLTGESNAVAAAKGLLKMGPRFMIVKKGEHGALLAIKDKVFAIPAMPLAAVKDPTGAGDSFAGGLVGYLASQNKANEKTLRQALAYGTATASFTCEDFSLNKLNKITKKDITKRVRDFTKLIAIP